MAEVVRILPGTYYDSVTLMKVSREIGMDRDVEVAIVAMATQLNREQVEAQGFGRIDAQPIDLMIAVRTRAGVAADVLADEAMAVALRLQSEFHRNSVGLPPSRSIRNAKRQLDQPTVALISVPGPHAFTEAMDALREGLHVVVFSDNVSISQEIALKVEGRRRDLLVMGPDCGTVVLSGTGLGFANVVRPGPVGLVAASGTGAQQVTALLDAADVGVRHILGVGGRDLTEEVGGSSTLQALALLDADPQVNVIAVVAKSCASAPLVALKSAISALTTPVVTILLSEDHTDLTEGTERILRVLNTTSASFDQLPVIDTARRSGSLRGLFAGGTLAQETRHLIEPVLGPVRSNLDGPTDLAASGHLIIDFGSDELTQGRPHPMIDQRLRLDRLQQDLADPDTAVILLDVVLGFGAHPDPASELAPIIAAAPSPRVPVIVSVVGTRDDPQGLDRQRHELTEAGAIVTVSNAAASRTALSALVMS